jgi:hypothetical protein
MLENGRSRLPISLLPKYLKAVKASSREKALAGILLKADMVKHVNSKLDSILSED